MRRGTVVPSTRHAVDSAGRMYRYATGGDAPYWTADPNTARVLLITAGT